jgi:hypothetical protein
MCGLHRTEGDKEHEFLSLASKPRSMVFPGLASKSVVTVLVFWPQNHSLGFPILILKTDSCGLVIWLTKPPRWFLWFSKPSGTRFVGLRLKTDVPMKMV